MFLVKFVNEQKIPFEVSIPNRQTIKVIKDVEKGHTVKVESLSSLIEEIDKELKKECPRPE